jgi:hypothetical protein
MTGRIFYPPLTAGPFTGAPAREKAPSVFADHFFDDHGPVRTAAVFDNAFHAFGKQGRDLVVYHPDGQCPAVLSNDFGLENGRIEIHFNAVVHGDFKIDRHGIVPDFYKFMTCKPYAIKKMKFP